MNLEWSCTFNCYQNCCAHCNDRLILLLSNLFNCVNILVLQCRVKLRCYQICYNVSHFGIAMTGKSAVPSNLLLVLQWLEKLLCHRSHFGIAMKTAVLSNMVQMCRPLILQRLVNLRCYQICYNISHFGIAMTGKTAVLSNLL